MFVYQPQQRVVLCKGNGRDFPWFVWIWILRLHKQTGPERTHRYGGYEWRDCKKIGNVNVFLGVHPCIIWPIAEEMPRICILVRGDMTLLRMKTIGRYLLSKVSREQSSADALGDTNASDRMREKRISRIVRKYCRDSVRTTTTLLWKWRKTWTYYSLRLKKQKI